MWYDKKRMKLSQLNSENNIYGDRLKKSFDTPGIKSLLSFLYEHGKEGLIAGGAVRDAIMGFSPKDIDIEVYNIVPQDYSNDQESFNELLNLVNQYLVEQKQYLEQSGQPVKFDGFADIVGESFGVVKLRDMFGDYYDLSLPRKDSKSGVGHRGFEVSINPNISMEDACSRRDLTINSMLYNPLNEELHDYFGGLDDLKNKVLRHTSPAFVEDPLRIPRMIQFAARFGFDIAPETIELSNKMVDEFYSNSWDDIRAKYPDAKDDYDLRKNVPYNAGLTLENIFTINPEIAQNIVNVFTQRRPDLMEQLSSKPLGDRKGNAIFETAERIIKNYPDVVEDVFNYPYLTPERIGEEWQKLALKGKYLSKGFDALVNSGWVKFYPEIGDMIGVPQTPKHHPEGSVDLHIKQVIDAAAKIAEEENLEGDTKVAYILSALLHDIGKATTTEETISASGEPKYTSYGHDRVGASMATRLLRHWGIKPEIIKMVASLIKNHMVHLSWGDSPSVKSINKLSKDLGENGANIKLLYLLMKADASGRNKGMVVDPKAQKVYDQAVQLGVDQSAMKPFIRGQDIIDIRPDLKPGIFFGDTIKLFETMQQSGKIRSREEALQKLAEYLRKK